MNLITRFDNHDDFFQYLDEILADFKLRVAKNHPDISKCEIHIDLKVIEFNDPVLNEIFKGIAARRDASIKRVN